MLAVSSFLLIAFCRQWCQGKTFMSQELDRRHKSSFWPWKHHHHPTIGCYLEHHHVTADTLRWWICCCLSSLSLTQASLLQAGLMSQGVGLGVRAVSSWVELCADMSFRINQAYQSDRCLSTCYKHLPRHRSCYSDYLQGSSLRTLAVFTRWLWL